MDPSQQPYRDAHQPPYSDAPPPYGFQAPPQQPQQPPQPQVVFVTQPQTRTVLITQAQMAGLGPNSLHTKCPSCQMEINTRLQQEISSRSHLFALLLCLFGCWPCVCVPYCLDSCKNTNHFCPNCNAYIGTYQA